MKVVKIPFTTDSTGADSQVFDIQDPVFGLAFAVQIIDGDCDSTLSVVVSAQQGDISIPILTKANIDVDEIHYPRVLESLNTDGTALATHTIPVVVGQPKVVVSSGGDVKSGAVVLYILDEYLR